ncbi:MAG: hypothetical protein CM15mP84_05730 [Cellvibrionales bacterium]|nr:MAG: hypothetical protein CM15mP84_05730 [Cellvibrionales bacterium]
MALLYGAGDPADGFENEAMSMAAETWSGRWWKHFGGGTVWNALTYDPDLELLYVGVGNGDPWDRDLRSEGEGDNLFLASIVALDANTGGYVWHYQLNPGEQWDYKATMDMVLAEITIDDAPAKCLCKRRPTVFFTSSIESLVSYSAPKNTLKRHGRKESILRPEDR